MKSLMRWLPFQRRDKLHPQRSTPSTEKSSIGKVRNEIDRVFEHFLRDPFGVNLLQGVDPWGEDFDVRSFAPNIDIADENAYLQVTVDLPGLDENDVRLVLQDQILILRGEKNFEKASKDNHYYRIERSCGRFERHIHLPVEVDVDNVVATFTNGVLSVRLEKVVRNEHYRSIPINS